MCYYITGVLAAGGDAAQVRRIAQDFLIRWEPIANRSLKPQLAAGEAYYSTTWGTCDCGTTLGADRKEPDSLTKNDKKVAKLRKQGWSAAKIERWLGDRQAAATRKEHAKRERGAVPGADAEQWAHFFRTVLSCKVATSIGLLLHWYKRGVENERFSVLENQIRATDELSAEFLAQIDEDVLYWFGNRMRRA